MSQPEYEYLGPYKIERTLGRGGMGTVYKGVHAKSGEAVAIKVIAVGIANNMRFRRRFAAEVETLKRLKHPHIVQLVGYGEEQGLLFYSMEFVDGHSLHEHLRQHGQLPWDEVLQIGIETTSALKHAHDIGIIHRDLKPANLMLNESGRIKLTDFGIAKLFGSSEMTAAGSVIGTADYMPPEQAEGKAVTVRSDLYSLGGVLYALLAGKAPFGGQSVPEVLYSVRYNPVPSLQDRVSGVPQEFIEIIHQLLEKDPLKRPPTALVVSNRLKSLQQGLRHIQSRGGTIDSSGQAAFGASDKQPIGPQLTSLDLSDVDDAELQLTGEESRVDAARVGELHSQLESPSREAPSVESMGTHDARTMLAPERMDFSQAEEQVTRIVGAPGSAPAGAAKSPPDAASAEFHSLASGTGPISSGGPSHFTPIDTQMPKPTTLGFGIPESEPTGDWLHYASIAGMALLLIGCVVFGWWMLRPSSADDVYQQVMAAVDSGDDAQMVQVGPAIEDFLERFPDDSRGSELQALSDEVELSRWTRILQRKASRSGGIENLSAIEQAFLHCVKLLSVDTDQAQQKFLAFLDVFGDVQALPRDEQKLVSLARYAVRVGVKSIAADEVSKAAAQLQALIEAAEESMPQERLQAYYKDLLALYGEMPWAKQHMDRIRKKVESGI